MQNFEKSSDKNKKPVEKTQPSLNVLDKSQQSSTYTKTDLVSLAKNTLNSNESISGENMKALLSDLGGQFIQGKAISSLQTYIGNDLAAKDHSFTPQSDNKQIVGRFELTQPDSNTTQEHSITSNMEQKVVHFSDDEHHVHTRESQKSNFSQQSEISEPSDGSTLSVSSHISDMAQSLDFYSVQELETTDIIIEKRNINEKIRHVNQLAEKLNKIREIKLEEKQQVKKIERDIRNLTGNIKDYKFRINTITKDQDTRNARILSLKEKIEEFDQQYYKAHTSHLEEDLQQGIPHNLEQQIRDLDWKRNSHFSQDLNFKFSELKDIYERKNKHFPDDWEENIKAYHNELINLTAEYKDLSETYKRLQNEYQDLTKKQNNQKQQYNIKNRKYEQTCKDYNNIKKQYEELKKECDEYKEKLKSNT